MNTSSSLIHWCISHVNHRRGTNKYFIFVNCLILFHSIRAFVLANSSWCRIVNLFRLHYIASFWMLAHVRPIILSVNILPFNIFDRCNLPLYEFVVKSGTLIANTALFITFDRVTLQLLHASLYWYRISNFNQQTRCISLSWTLVLATIVEWPYFHVGWSISVVSQESDESLVTWYSNVICVHRSFWAFFYQEFL